MAESYKVIHSGVCHVGGLRHVIADDTGVTRQEHVEPTEKAYVVRFTRGNYTPAIVWGCTSECEARARYCTHCGVAAHGHNFFVREATAEELKHLPSKAEQDAIRQRLLDQLERRRKAATGEAVTEPEDHREAVREEIEEVKQVEALAAKVAGGKR